MQCRGGGEIFCQRQSVGSSEDIGSHWARTTRWEKTPGISGGLLVGGSGPIGGSGRLVDSEMDADDVL